MPYYKKYILFLLVFLNSTILTTIENKTHPKLKKSVVSKKIKHCSAKNKQKKPGLNNFVSKASFATSDEIKNETSINQYIEKISKTTPGTIGVAALHIEKNQLIEFNGDTRFPMASTYKLPIALYCLSLAEEGKINLQSKMIATKYVRRRFCFNIKLNEKLSITKLIQLMIEESDNTASDMILKVVGGPRTITEWLQKHEINQISIDRSYLKMSADYYGIQNLGDKNHCTAQHFCNLIKQLSKKDQEEAINKFYDDTRDTSTPIEMVNLINKMYKGELVSSYSLNFLLESMLVCKWGEGLIRRFLPEGTKFWHKTGQMDGLVADVGIIELPNKKGHLALAMYTNKSMALRVNRKKAIALISKALFDYFSK